MTKFLIDPYETKPGIIEDLKDFDSTSNSLSITSKVKNIERLKNLEIDNLWLFSAKEKDIEKIFNLIQPKYVSLYQVLINDLSCLENLKACETLLLDWNTKATKLWDFKKNKKLKNLSIRDFSKISNIDEIENISQLKSLSLEGGMWKPMKLDSLKSIAVNRNLGYLRLINLRLKDNSLKPLWNLSKLELLDISNQFPTKEIAGLSRVLLNTKCSLFQPYIDVEIKDQNNNLKYDVMIVGKRKPFLLKSKDNKRLEKYIKEFKRFKQEN
ncbi:hypothetical protein [Formosa algae]|uniref:Internalin n=1 Tax=Formosa algae TaxID=225843 RepID=A0A9X0YK85_9FLAO|nr:hypothetical protein [Formosa algae]MBP1840115.1 hypothetical protein [Formosa algae]MDQ0335715.1 hypothetical protein [Formosa algae]OEI79756.1 hypothetical protein AST99_12615 [Formosa algae]